MSTITPENQVEQWMTLADVVRHLGDISPQRIRLQPTPGTAVLEDLVRIAEKQKCLCELIDGTLVEKTVGYEESCIALTIATALMAFVKEHKLGRVAGSDGTLQFPAELVFIPDVSFTSWERLPGRTPVKDAIPKIIPDLAVEVLSRSNTKREMERKLKEYLAAGVRLVWYIEPQNQTVIIHSNDEPTVTLQLDDTLTGGDVLPGFEIAVKAIFAME